jgi:hypothetical protein
MSSTQPSQLLPTLFEDFEDGDRLTVLHIGPALPETVEFFSRYRCKLHFLDLFDELPLAGDEDPESAATERLAELLQFPADTRFDICLFWDLFNYLDRSSASRFIELLQPHLHARTRAHGFGVHNLRSPQGDELYGIRELAQLSVRHRPAPLPGYTPHNQQQLQGLLSCFSFIRSILLADSRLELLLRAKLPAQAN